MVGLPPMLMLCECKSEQETENRRINKQAEGGRGQKHRGGEWMEIKAVDTAARADYAQFIHFIQCCLGLLFIAAQLYIILLCQLNICPHDPLVWQTCTLHYMFLNDHNSHRGSVFPLALNPPDTPEGLKR